MPTWPELRPESDVLREVTSDAPSTQMLRMEPLMSRRYVCHWPGPKPAGMVPVALAPWPLVSVAME